MRWLGTDGVDSIQRRTVPIDIGGKDAEEILLTLGKTLDSKVGALAEAGDDDPFVVPDVSPLNPCPLQF
jgi:hypothetical protein